MEYLFISFKNGSMYINFAGEYECNNVVHLTRYINDNYITNPYDLEQIKFDIARVKFNNDYEWAPTPFNKCK